MAILVQSNSQELRAGTGGLRGLGKEKRGDPTQPNLGCLSTAQKEESLRRAWPTSARTQSHTAWGVLQLHHPPHLEVGTQFLLCKMGAMTVPTSKL